MTNKGTKEGLPYSLSRWTDVPAAKWEWMQKAVRDQQMLAFDSRTGVPGVWSLDPCDTLGLVFWTKNPYNLVHHAPWLREYEYKVHVTATGWHEVEKGAPDIERSARLLAEAVGKFGPDRVTWRFSPVPAVADVVPRFGRLLDAAATSGLTSVYVSFLQTNDLMREGRGVDERVGILTDLANLAARRNVRVLLCNEDRMLAGRTGLAPNLGSGVCARPEDFGLEARSSEGCGCVWMVDPFTFNESCTMGCQYCYAADKTLSPKKRNTTLPVIQ